MNTWNESGLNAGKRWTGRACVAVCASVILSGCATTPAPTDQVAVSTAAIAQADTAGAPDLAAAEMRIARGKLLRVNAAMAAKDYRHALWLAQEAQLDAELAELKARSSKATSAADAAKLDTQALRDELARKIHGR